MPELHSPNADRYMITNADTFTPGGLRILVADDNPINLRVATRLLREMGHSGVLVTDGERAIKALAAQRFDLILMDVTMPVLDGLSAVAEIRALERQGRPRTTVIMVTAFDLPSDRARMLAAGADGYVAKPLELVALQAELTRLGLAGKGRG